MALRQNFVFLLTLGLFLSSAWYILARYPSPQSFNQYLCSTFCSFNKPTDSLPKRPPVLPNDMEAANYKLPPLPYAYNALEPHISKQIMELHHSKHHQTYVTNLNAALENQVSAIKNNDVPAQIANQQAIKFHGGGHINHSLFWTNLAPTGDAATDPQSAPKLIEAIKQHWGSVDQFQDKLGKVLLSIQGSGWGWLVKHSENGSLALVTTKDQDPVDAVYVPIIGIDMWEHAYYLDYLNVKAKYVENIWKVLNFKTAEERFNGNRPDAFKVLKASM